MTGKSSVLAPAAEDILKVVWEAYGVGKDELLDRLFCSSGRAAPADTLRSYIPLEKEWAAAFRISSGTTAACLFSRFSRTHLNSVLITMSSVAAFLSR